MLSLNHEYHRYWGWRVGVQEIKQISAPNLRPDELIQFSGFSKLITAAMEGNTLHSH